MLRKPCHRTSGGGLTTPNVMCLGALLLPRGAHISECRLCLSAARIETDQDEGRIEWGRTQVFAQIVVVHGDVSFHEKGLR